MKRSTDGFRCHELETVEAPEITGGEVRFVNRKLYVVDGQTGLYRRLPRSGPEVSGQFSAWFMGSVVTLVRDRDTEGELREAGYLHDQSVKILEGAVRKVAGLVIRQVEMALGDDADPADDFEAMEGDGDPDESAGPVVGGNGALEAPADPDDDPGPSFEPDLVGGQAVEAGAPNEDGV